VTGVKVSLIKSGVLVEQEIAVVGEGGKATAVKARKIEAGARVSARQKAKSVEKEGEMTALEVDEL